MKRLNYLLMTGILVTAMPLVAFGGYRDLKRDLDSYTPPNMLQQPKSIVSAGVDIPNTFETERKVIEAAYDRWVAALQRRILPENVSQLNTTATNDSQALAALQDQITNRLG